MTFENKLSARQQNLQSILTLLDTNEKLSAKELAKLTGLSIVSINKLLDILNDSTNIIDSDYINTRGRRAKLYKLNYDSIKLGILQLVEIDNQIQAIYYLTNLAGTVLSKKVHDQKIDSIEELTNFLQKQTIQDPPAKIVIGTPGAELDGYLQLSDLEVLQGINLPLAVKTATDIDTIVVNDANAGTYGAAIELNQSKNSAVGIYFPNSFGPGVGIVINNHLIQGADGLAGEVEYSTVDQTAVITEQIINHLQNIISLLNPNLILVYVEKLGLTPIQIDQIKQTIHRNLPLHQKYQLNFERNFEKDYLTGLTTIGRHDILKSLVSD